MFGGIGFIELLVVLIIVLIIFGANRIPKVAKSLGEGIKEFKKAQEGRFQSDDDTKNEEKQDPCCLHEKDNKKK